MNKQIIVALQAAQKEFPVIPKGKTATVPTKSGGKYSYSYADLSSVVDAVTPVLHKHGLSVNHTGKVEGERQVLVTSLNHISGEYMDSHFLLPKSDDPQDTGGSITYFSRYSLCAILGIVTEDDSDGQQKPKAPKDAARNDAPPPRLPTEPTSIPETSNVTQIDQLITTAQLKRLFAIAASVGASDAVVKNAAAAMGIKSRTEIPKSKYEKLCGIVQSWKP